MRLVFYYRQTLAVWFVADSEALSFQATPSFNKRENIETSTATAINYTTCVRPA
jgi:hypothetical protein